MIGRISGTLYEKNAPLIGLEAAGIGYELLVPMSTFFTLPELNQHCTLLTVLVIREDAHTLYGFATLDEKNLFKTLIKISGIGPRTALAVLSSISTTEFMQAVASQDITRLVKIPGIGKKTAERLLLELKGQLQQLTQLMPQSSQLSGSNPTRPFEAEITAALLALGYSEKEAQSACKPLPENISTGEGLKQALRFLSKT